MYVFAAGQGERAPAGHDDPPAHAPIRAKAFQPTRKFLTRFTFSFSAFDFTSICSAEVALSGHANSPSAGARRNCGSSRL